ncbi:unnamed protein product, partial [Porites lobata]
MIKLCPLYVRYLTSTGPLMTCHALKRKREKENSYSEVKRDEEVKKPIRSGSPNDIRNKEDISKNDQKSPLYL